MPEEGSTAVIGEIIKAGSSTAPDQATATASLPLQKLWIVRTRMSSENFISNSQDLDQDLPEEDRRKREITFRFRKETRNQIKVVRMTFRETWLLWVVKFYGLHICNEAGVDHIKEATKKADAALKEIGAGARAREVDLKVDDLHAEPVFIPLDVAEIAKGALYSQVLGAIQGQVCETMLKRVEKTLSKVKDPEKITTRTRKSLTNLLNQLGHLNIINDKAVDEQIREIRRTIETETLGPLKTSLQELLKTSAGRYGAIELL
jgi:hypothetical protein